VRINNISIKEVIIDPHYEIKHSKSIDDRLIIELVKKLDGEQFDPESTSDGFEYYVAEELSHAGKLYKLVWLLEKNKLYIGVVNAYRRKK